MKEQADIGLIGLAVMGENLVLNMESHGYTVAVFNRTVSKVDAFVEGRGKGKNFIPAHSIEELVNALKKPRKVMMLVKAGEAVDDCIEQTIPHLDPGDIIIDGGNTYYPDTVRRTTYLENKGLLYIGTGVSGGEEGALTGPSIMPGGSKKAWPHVKGIFQDISARVKGAPCCQWVGSDGAGHFVKMVHNGIEYGDMQLIAEAYHIMKNLVGLSFEEMQSIFSQWNKGDLDSYLIEITSDILGYIDENNEPLVEKILDVAGQKGTGKWTVFAALDLGTPLTLIDASVSSRLLSYLRDERRDASKQLPGPEPVFSGVKTEFLKNLEQALYASKIVSYTQGFALMKAADDRYGWGLKYGNIALMWRGGCIIRSVFLDHINEAFRENPDLKNLLVSPFFREKIASAQAGWRKVISEAILNGIPVPAMASGLAYYDGYRSAGLPANLIQAQRDYFGAHTYERVDKPRGERFHTNWTGRGGSTASTSYNV
jgi:6-phosphogluconate dehydrogenase